MLDSMLLQRFPGKTLEELDQVNWPRLMRAMAAGEVERIEQLIELQRTGKAKPTNTEWRVIVNHDRLWNAVRGRADDDDEDEGDEDEAQ